MIDETLRTFLEDSYEQGMALAQSSDILALAPVAGDPPQRYIAEYRCRGLVRDDSGNVVEANRFAVGIWFPKDYLRRVRRSQVLAWLGPPNVLHPNISARTPLICIGRLRPGTDLVSILFQLYEIISWQKFATHDPLNEEASQWARNQDKGRFPIDPRPLKRKALKPPAEAPAGDKR
jgi:hypothetical protein